MGPESTSSKVAKKWVGADIIVRYATRVLAFAAGAVTRRRAPAGAAP